MASSEVSEVPAQTDQQEELHPPERVKKMIMCSTTTKKSSVMKVKIKTVFILLKLDILLS